MAKPKSKTSVTAVAAKPGPTSGAAKLWQQYWANPDDDLLRIYADALEQDGDPRGRFIQLSLAGAATKAEREVFQRKHGGALVGPAKMFLREYEFASNGLVEKGRTELAKLLEGVDQINQISPRFVLTLTSIKTLKDAVALGAMSSSALGKIYMIDFGMITGSFGGCQLNDKQLAAIAPAFAEVRHLQLSCAGAPGKAFSPDGLRAFGKHATSLVYLALDYYDAGQGSIADYGRAIAETFPALRALDFYGGSSSAGGAYLSAKDFKTKKLLLNKIGNLNYKHRNGLATKLEKLLG